MLEHIQLFFDVYTLKTISKIQLGNRKIVQSTGKEKLSCSETKKGIKLTQDVW